VGDVNGDGYQEVYLTRLSLFAVKITNLKNILAVSGLVLGFVGSKWPKIVCSADLATFQVQ